jgi:hypothetical protein
MIRSVWEPLILGTGAFLILQLAFSGRSESSVVPGSLMPLAQRAILADEIVGTRLDFSIIAPQANLAIEDGAYVLLRVLDGANCAACFGDLGAWNSLVDSPSIVGLIALRGEASPDLRRLLRAARSEGRLSLSEGGAEISSELLPDTYILASSDGTVLLVDGRMGRGDCAWSFAAQVGTLLGLPTSQGIRSVVQSVLDEGHHLQ